ncbi:hypothetical protein KU73_16390 [Pectobacterium wasabiae]|uniref:Uncharacterized protein n=1 Tax=Pectobacterium wasabiae TaxID=55208 RepID=A0AAW3EEL6_9GAMM|nr:hypothetical protein A7983_09015 [Pectobacterium wasabiae CFBP 3304]KFX04103.1 hypothetical protein JV38_16400 [Pectobacterium wasabiae]KGA27237.1 hypothetical protein KU73_16390 [Pectobacterium wasabiae]
MQDKRKGLVFMKSYLVLIEETLHYIQINLIKMLLLLYETLIENFIGCIVKGSKVLIKYIQI